MNKLTKIANDEFIYYIFHQNNFKDFLEDDKMTLSDLEILDFGKSNLCDVAFISDDTFVVGYSNTDNSEYTFNNLEYEPENNRYDYYNGIFVGYSKELDITITMNHIEEFHIFKGDILKIVDFYTKEKKELKII